MTSSGKQRGSEAPVSLGMGFKEGPHLGRQESRCYRKPGALLQGRQRAGTQWEKKVSCVCGFPPGSRGRLGAGGDPRALPTPGPLTPEVPRPGPWAQPAFSSKGPFKKVG